MLDEGEKAIVKEVVAEALKLFKEELAKMFEQQIKLHAATCPGKKMWLLLIGIALGSGVGSALGWKLISLF